MTGFNNILIINLSLKSVYVIICVYLAQHKIVLWLLTKTKHIQIVSSKHNKAEMK